MSSPAIFLDRDGTLLTERGYLADPKKIFFYRGVFSALRKLKKAGFKLIVVTNQSGVARGFLTMATLKKINREFTRRLARNGVRIDGIFFCPHAPDAGCVCRKPKPTLALRAARQKGIDIKRSYVIGDQWTDMKLSKNLGVPGILVLTGAGRASRRKAGPLASKISSNFPTAAGWVLSRL
jgi:histidinol-phosphate phosphatase family protein